MPGNSTGPLGTRQQRLIDAYLTDLRRCLRDVDPRQAEDIEESIVEHITAALVEAGTPSVEDVQAVLEKLGPVERIVSAADTRTSAESGSSTVAAAPPGGASAGAIALLMLAVLALAFSGLWFIGGPLGLVSAITGLIAARQPGAGHKLYRFAGWVGLCAVALTVVFALVLTSAKTTVSPDEPPVVTSSTATTIPTSR